MNTLMKRNKITLLLTVRKEGITMEKIINLNKEQFINKVLSLKPGQGFDFAATHRTYIAKPEEGYLETWFGVKVIEEFDQQIALIGYYSCFPVRGVSMTKDDIEGALDIFADYIDFNHEGCYVFEEE